MRSCQVVEFITPKRFRLLGLWYGQKRPKNAVVLIHGLGGSVFSMRDLVRALAIKNVAVLVFNNRGAEVISKLRRVNSKRSLHAGMAHEVFTDCADDIQGAINFVKKQGAKNIFLAGHSTGTQKSVYWAYKKKSRGVQGIILLAPISDYSSTLKTKGLSSLARAEKAARTLIRQGRKHALLPVGVWQTPIDAERYISLYTPLTVEDVFPYADAKRRPNAVQTIKKPVLVLLAEKDEYGDRPAREIAGWFEKHLRNGRAIVVPRVNHGFQGAEQRVVKEITHFIRG